MKGKGLGTTERTRWGKEGRVGDKEEDHRQEDVAQENSSVDDTPHDLSHFQKIPQGKDWEHLLRRGK